MAGFLESGRLGLALLAAAAGLLASPEGVPAQHQHPEPAAAEPGLVLHAGAHAVALGSRVSPGVGGRAETEAYLTQPTLHGAFSAWGGLLAGQAAISLEGLTLERGELAPGAYGEGYIDRRHPHTYLHEAVLTVRPVPFASLAAGRGFAPFGTDDPMVRPFVRFPVNHHLGQLLERLILVGAVRGGPVLLEGSLFSGAEPESAGDVGSLDRFADSWSARVTLLPVAGMELQVSRAEVTSPEFVVGEGWDQRKWSVSARVARSTGLGEVYALAEWKRTTEIDEGEDLFSFGSVLLETSLSRSGWTGALRAERTDRPEEERRAPYRTPWPHVDTHVLGISRWTTASARLERDLQLSGVRIAPFVEGAISRVDMKEPGLFDPMEWYGTRTIRGLSAGARIGLGSVHARMGRYGVALPQ